MTTDDITALMVAIVVGVAAFLAGWRAADFVETRIARRAEARERRGRE